MNKLLSIILVISLAIFFTGCVKKTNPPTENLPKELIVTDVSAYFPADAGSTWTYEGQGNEYAGFKRTVIHREGTLVQFSENNGGTQMGLVYKITPEAVTLLYAVEEHYTDASVLRQQPNRNEVLLQAPLRQGATWQDARYKREVVSTRASVSVPGGTFNNAVQIKSTPLHQTTSAYLIEYYVPNMGLVSREYISNEFQVTSKLKSWSRK